MEQQGYYRFPTISGDTIVFASESDLWAVPSEGGIARRLTADLGNAAFPRFSPDGERLAFSGSVEGPSEVYVMPGIGGEPRRLTFLGAEALVCGWDPEGYIVFASHSGQPFPHLTAIFRISPDGGEPERVPVGPALSVSYGPDGGMVLGRYGMKSREPAYWKRYRGGTAGDLWVDADGSGSFSRLISVEGNVTHPVWAGRRIYFVSDHEGIGNLYSVLPDGSELTRHTDHEDYYVRHASTDGTRIVYHAGADLYRFDIEKGRSVEVPVSYPSPRPQRMRKYVRAAKFLEMYRPHPKGHKLSVVARGKPFQMGNWEGAVSQRGEADGVRYRHAAWLHDGARMVMVSDAEGEEFLELHREDPLAPVDRFTELDLGRVLELEPAPKDDRVAVCNHRNELLIVDVTDREVQRVDVSEHLMIADIDWSPDGRYLAYAFARSQHESVIKIYDSRAQESHVVTPPMRWDTDPVFGPEGKHLYFIGRRELDPVYDSIHFDLGFPRAGRPYVVLLQSDLRSPFLPQPEPEEEAESAKPASGGANGSEGSDDAGASESSGSGAGGAEGSSAAPEIAFRGIEDRVLAFPVSVATYGAPAALSNKLLYTRYPIRGTLEEKPEAKEGPAADAALVAFDFKTQSEETLVPGITSYRLAADRKTLVYRAGDGLRVVRAGEKPDEKAAGEGPGRKSGWVDLSRVRISVSPPAEWKQMYREAWRLQRDNFWNASMSDVDWEEVYRRYLPLLDRVSTRVEFSDLMWEMQGELGTSHAYEMGGDYPQRPNYRLGFLAADVAFDAERGLWRITSIVRGDPAHEKESSPLARGGAQVAENSTLLAIDGRQADGRSSPGELLVNKADTEVALTVGDADGENPRTVSVKPLDRELPARYREWVEANRRAVHEATEGRAGYIHIPDMAPTGYAEFHRSFLPEIDREGLVVDVRFNRGGHVSNLLLEKLARRRLAYVVSRWFGTEPWPDDSPAGPMVALTNEMSGSDGDIFSHTFKLMELGPLIGKRTWGGVVGIWPRQPLVDRTLTSQPEFSFWFTDVGWQVENYGTDPDIPVEIAPQDYAAGRDPQLERAIREVQTRIEQHVAPEPDLSTRPSRTVPRLPRRG